MRRTLAAGLAVLLATIAATVPPGTPGTSAIAADDEVVVLELDEGDGTTATDSSGDRHDGTLVGGATYSSETADGSPSAVDLDGTDDRIDLGPVDVDGEGLTLAAWFEADGFAEPYRDPRLISKATGTEDGDHVFMLGTIAAGANTVLRGRLRVDGTTTTLIATAGPVSADAWHHAALTHDGATLRLFLDGAEVASTALTGEVDVDPSVPVAIGGQPEGAGNRYFDGRIDDVRILSRAMTSGEIEALAGVDTSRPPADDASTSEASATTVPATEPTTEEAATEGTTAPSLDAAGDVGATRVEEDLLALYTFQEGDGDVVADVSGSEPRLDLTIDDAGAATWRDGALSVDDATVVASSGPATKIVDAAESSGAISVEAWVAPQRVDQDGPARIVSIAESTGRSNLTVGQGLWGSQPSDLYSARVRTTATDPTGRPELTSPSGTLDTSLTHVVHTRASSGAEVLYVDGVPQASTVDDGVLDDWDRAASLLLANDPSGERPWLGELDLVALYGRALTAEEVARNFAAGPDDGTATTTTADGAPVDESSEPTPPADEIPFTRVEVDPTPPEQAHVKALGDISGDGLPDAVAGGGREGDGLYWYEYPDWTEHEIAPPGTGFTTDMKIVDVDGDGDEDVVVPTGFHRGEQVWWFENPAGDGDPRTDDWIAHEIGSAPAHDVEVADVDGDGSVDVVVRDHQLTLFLQESPDRWTAVALGDLPVEGTDVGDIDADGDVDIVAGPNWLENPLPSGAVEDPWTVRAIVAEWPPEAAATIADYDGDGRPDIALAPAEIAGGRLSWFEGPEDPRDADEWEEHVVDPDVEYLHQFQAADVDLDGDVDLVTAEMHQAAPPQNVSVYRNDGGGLTWTEQVIATTGSHNLQVGDVGGDGDVDVLGVNWHGLTPLELWRNDLDPGDPADGRGGQDDQPQGIVGWERHVIADDLPARAVFVEDVDVNGDGLLDVVTGGWWYENTGSIDGGWERHTIGEPLRQMAAVHDFDGDGDPDVLGTQGVGSDPNSDFAWAENDGTGDFTIHTDVESGIGDFLQGATVARFDEAIQVVLSWHDRAVGLQMLTVPSDPAEDPWTIEPLSATSLGEGLDHGDVDGDGDLDLSLGTIWFRNDDSGWSEHLIHEPSVGEPDRVHLVDLDGDGDLDSLVGYGHDPEGKLAWYENPGDPEGAWAEHLMANVANPQSVDHADLDGDGDVDVVAGEHRLPGERPEESALFVMENADGSGGSWDRHGIHVGDEHHDGAQLGDFDGDGDLDVVSIGWTHPQLLLYENTGS